MDVNHFLKVVGRCGQNYLHHGGPTTRLEDKVIQVGRTYDLDPEVWSTPTGLFISIKYQGQVYTSLERIDDSANNFKDLLFFGKLFDQMASQEISLDEAIQEMDAFETNRYPVGLVAFSAFGIGFMASFLKFGFVYGALVSGVITSIVFALKRPLKRRFHYSGVFSDFISCLLAFTLSLLVVSATEQPMIIFVIGSLILIVPGLSLTTAISELAEHNFVSGTVKLVRAVLILVAMGVAYLLVENVVFSFNLPSELVILQAQASPLANKAWFQAVGSVFLIAAFCIFFHIPKRAIPGAVCCGMISVIVLEQFLESQLFVLASFLASFTVGIISLFLSRVYKWPSQVFSTPGILTLVPGLLALSTFYDLNQSGEGQIAYRVALTAGAIVFGLLTARMPFRLYDDN